MTFALLSLLGLAAGFGGLAWGYFVLGPREREPVYLYEIVIDGRAYQFASGIDPRVAKITLGKVGSLPPLPASIPIIQSSEPPW